MKVLLLLALIVTLTIGGQTHEWHITVRTRKHVSAGTNADVYISLTGPGGTSADHELDDPNRDDFESGHVDQFTINTKEIGRPTKVTVRQNGDGHNPDWMLDWIDVKDILGTKCTGHAYFNRWIEEHDTETRSLYWTCPTQVGK